MLRRHQLRHLQRPTSNYCGEIALIRIFEDGQSLHLSGKREGSFLRATRYTESPSCEALVHSLQLQLKAHIQFVLGMRG